ncbi:hypothetical protein N657DRAFT_642552 [Parathielavia appendiculata]|uniref:Uncharacterized protein n=1 Tax=Parathielavia appendiculata TaxID=2587402 RepID=A0AAN6U4Q6_9PEZI|nr:hypothetical protein N657DRAFT_642552 [Parathielavia appendiculata]
MAFTGEERTILGPLTTVFTPPAPCTIAVGFCSTCDVAWLGQTCAPTTVQDDPSCWPTTTAGAPEPGRPLYGWGFYSPGLECPAGYTSACSAIAGKTSGWKVQYLMEPEETFVGCCPTGFNCDNLNGQTCRHVATSTTLPTVSCESGSSNNFGFTTLPAAKVSALHLYAPMIQLAWKATDRPDFDITSSAGTSGPTTTSPPTTASTATNTPLNEPPTSTGPPLSNGAVAGIAVGSAALFLLIMAAAVFVWRRRRRNSNSNSSTGNDLFPSDVPPSYPSDAKYYYTGNASELGEGHERAEVPGDALGFGPAEVSGQGHERVEMSAEHRGHAPAPALGTKGSGGENEHGVAFHANGLCANAPVEMPTERYT